MPARIEGARAAAIVALTALAVAVPARAQESSPPDAEGWKAGPRLEITAGPDAPLGTYSGALVIRTASPFSFGVGGGAFTGQPRGTHWAGGTFVRGVVWRHGPFAVGPALTLSFSKRTRDVEYTRPGFADTFHFSYDWKVGVRLDAGVGAEAELGPMVFRLQVGLGVYLNDPQCFYTHNGGGFVGDCHSPEIPEPYHFTFEAGRLAPYASLAVGFNANRAGGQPSVDASEGDELGGASAVGAPSVGRIDAAWLAPTALTVPAGSVTLTVHEALLLRVTAGFTESVQIWAGTTWLDVLGVPGWEVGGKVALLPVDGRFHLSLVAEHAGLRLSSYQHVLLTGFGGVGSVCVDASCRSVLSLSAMGGWLYDDPDEGQQVTTAGVLVSPSAVVAINGWLSVVGEVHVWSPSPSDGLWAALVRLNGDRLAFLVGAVGLYKWGDVLPAISFSYRW